MKEALSKMTKYVTLIEIELITRKPTFNIMVNNKKRHVPTIWSA
jgi:hypothetical protein